MRKKLSKLMLLLLLSFPAIAQEEAPMLKPNFESNLTAFYYLIGIVFSLLVTINIVAVSIKNLMQSEQIFAIPQAHRIEIIGQILSKFSKGISLFFILIIALYSSLNLHLTLSLPGSVEKTPWLHVYDMDIYFFLGISILLLAMLLFLVHLFNKLLALVVENKQVK